QILLRNRDALQRVERGVSDALDAIAFVIVEDVPLLLVHSVNRAIRIEGLDLVDLMVGISVPRQLEELLLGRELPDYLLDLFRTGIAQVRRRGGLGRGR